MCCQAEDLDSLIADSLSGVQAALDGDRKVLGGRCAAHDESMGGTGILTYIYIPNKSLPNVDKYTSPMDPMGVDLLHLITFPETNSLPMNILNPGKYHQNGGFFRGYVSVQGG